MNVVLRNLTKSYGEFKAVKDCCLEIKHGELITLLGPSGCGKTTLLRMVAGLLSPDGGQLMMGGQDMTHAPAQTRKAAMVFQHYALFPNLNVLENVAFGLKAAGMPKEEIYRKVGLALERVDLASLGNRRMDELSGGQKQRVALARALAVEPNVLLLDEPLSNLDEKLRQSMRRNIRALQQELGMTTIYVTHDQQEAMAISDRIAVMNQGVIQQIGRPHEVYNTPRNAFVADFIGHANLLKGKILHCDAKGCKVKLLGRERDIHSVRPFADGDDLQLMIRPEAIRVADAGIPATIQWMEHLGAVVRYTVACEGHELLVDRMSTISQRPEKPGDRLWIDFEDSAIVVLEP